jgi:acetyl esterase/lipase
LIILIDSLFPEPMKLRAISFLCVFWAVLSALAADPLVLPVWPSDPPDDTMELPPEKDMTTEDSGKVEGKRVARITNVSTPTITVYRPQKELDTGASVVICPGGGHRILAWDLEGTEVADWLNSIGVTGMILKYRVPARHKEPLWRSAVQDAQRAVRLVRSRASEWKLDPDRVGILGFSAGGQTAAMASILHEGNHYQPIDAIDDLPSRPDFAVLVYPAWLVDEEMRLLKPEVRVTESTPPMFFAHAMDDPITVDNSILLGRALKDVGVHSEIHLYDGGGHGFGLRESRFPCSTWPVSCERWMRIRGLLP